MLDVSDLVSDPDLAQTVTVYRSQGSFALGGWSESLATLSISSAVVVASERDLRQAPEGDRVAAAMMFYSAQPLYVTRVAPQPGTSDIIVWNGDQYRLIKVWPYSDYGYYKAMGVRMSGE